ncbi:hypothetical protein BBJ28_00001315 [Nothophytophthora sp. Chile5]|nr:hypothetical protein BBJ28_00001315 [Nothophytophthora sp. Chile5]
MASQSGVKRQRVAVSCGRRAPVGTPRSLQFALPDLSSLDTLHLLHSMRTLPSELRHLNSSNRLVDNQIHDVFGWRHMLWPEDDADASNRVIWKSAKALDAMSMGTLARQIWRRSSRAGSSGERRQVLYQVNSKTRVVRSTKRRRRGRDQIWLECFLDDGLQICVARKELRRFNEYRAPKTAAAECQGFLVRPVYAKASNARVMGCTLQCLRAVDARGGGVDAARTLKRQMVEDLPRFTLQWEEEHLYDLVPMPDVLLQTVFASRDTSQS